jgi:acyl carrier protein
LSREEIFEGMKAVFEEVLGRPVELRDETTAADVDGWDSVAHVMLILASERRFNVRFESSEIANAANVGEFVTLLESKTGQVPRPGGAARQSAA